MRFSKLKFGYFTNLKFYLEGSLEIKVGCKAQRALIILY